MAFTDLGAASVGTVTTYITDYSVPSSSTDGATGEREFRWQNTKSAQYFGYYKNIPELKAAIDAKAMWTIGKGFETNELTSLLLSTIKGFGKDSFCNVMRNLIVTYNLQGDAFAEIIRDEQGYFINLKPLDPGTIVIIADSKGIIKRYEQVTKVGETKTTKRFDVEDIFHLSRNRVADEIHGTGIVEACEWIILARNEAMSDVRKVSHRNVYPVRVWTLDTDVPSEIAAFKAKVAQSKGEGEDIFIPKGSVETELASVPENGTMSLISWIRELNGYFYQAVGVPQIIIGGSQELTQTAAQVAYMAFEQTVEADQLYIEEQILAQLNLEIELEFPASLQQNLLSDDAKDGTMEQQLAQPGTTDPSAGLY